jgi:integrase
VLAKVFPRQRVLGQRRYTHQEFLTAVNRLKKHLGRESLVSDLNLETFARFAVWLDQHYTVASVEQTKTAIRNIWRQLQVRDVLASGPCDNRRRHDKRSLWSQASIEPLARGETPATVRQLFTYVYVPLRLRGKSQRTAHQYRIYVDHLAKFLEREPLLSDFDDEVIGAFFHWLVETGRSPASANKARNHILALWRLAARKRFVEQFPDVPRLHEPARIPKAWTQADLSKLFATIEGLPGEIGVVPAGAWWLALHHLLWWTAERIGAVLQLRWSDIDLDSGWLIIPAEFRKFQTCDKATELPPEAINAMRAIVQPQRELILPWPQSKSWLWGRYKKILKRAGLPTDRKSSFHRMRRSAASHFEAAGGNATELLGHSSRRVTMAYLSPIIVKPQQTVGMLFSPGAVAKGGAT